jgi:hypothetical protein
MSAETPPRLAKVEQFLFEWAFACIADAPCDSLPPGAKARSARQARPLREETRSRRHGLA